MMELEARRQKMTEDENKRALRGQKDFLHQEMTTKARQNQERELTDEKIVHSLYSLEIKLKDGQMRAKNWQEENLKGKARMHNKKVEEIKGFNSSIGTSSQEQLGIERLNKVVKKSQQVAEFTKIKKEDEVYENERRRERAQANA